MNPSLPQFDADLRREQIEAARRMADGPDADMDALPTPRPTLTVRRNVPRGEGVERARGAASHLKPVTLRGHEAFLKALEFSGAVVVVEKISDGSKIRGTLKHSDKYTLTVRSSSTEDGVPVTRERVIFKHDISEFYSLTPRTEVGPGNHPRLIEAQ